jgi:hypothetical protein
MLTHGGSEGYRPGLYNGCMKQLNLNVTPEFERDLKLFMKRKGIKRKSDAIRTAFRELAERAKTKADCDFHSLLGIGLKAPLNPNPRFKTEDELWS